ncbi:hypothetical protein AAF712_006735 [Marasmius tenuissimus]|uniref:Major facilitator superfamily (MFS) profile domain-containing protein n=1 Tax=Marasmius tenuissimus TaxID=585030 RepID=A0ABR2ZYU3_9AGAR
MALFYMQGVPIGWVSIMLALLASMGGFIFGYDTGQIFRHSPHGRLSPSFRGMLRAWRRQQLRILTCPFRSHRRPIISRNLVRCTLRCPTADFLGRRYAMSVECLVFIVGVIIQITSFSSWEQFAVGRLVSGLAVGALSAAVPMYQAETAPSQIRGTLTATYQLFITFGILVAYCISIGAREMKNMGSWQLVVGIGIIWPFILGFGILFMPESPRWLARHGKMDEAAVAVARTRGISRDQAQVDPLVVTEVEEMRKNVEWERQFTGQTGWLDCFKPANKTLYRTLLGMSLQSLQQLTGANYFFYYGATIFQSVGIQDSFVTQIILGAVNFFCTFGGLYVMEKVSTLRPSRPLIVGGLWQSAWLFVFAAAGVARDPKTDPTIGKLMIVSACLFILGYATTWAPGVWILIGETFATRTRAKQGALSTASNWLWNFLLAFFTPFIVRDIEFGYGSDLTLEAVDEMYNDPNCKPWTSRKWRKYISGSRTKGSHSPEESRVENAGTMGGSNGSGTHVNEKA